jgi:HEAT repeat protein
VKRGKDEILALIQALDQKTYGASEDQRERLVEVGPDFLPYALDMLPKLKNAHGRNALVYTAMKFSRVSDQAVQLGITAMKDRSYPVRYHAAMLLAVSLSHQALPALQLALTHKDPKTVADATAAINAIQSANHNLFLSRNGSGAILSIMGLVEPT